MRLVGVLVLLAAAATCVVGQFQPGVLNSTSFLSGLPS
jgi:hypothetical protein